ncbi:MAG: sugar phosphate isomerase/epimerase [Chloroflexota bacterium]|nr:MAG: sugar phosphate isomerase/epimerase [Chloroflexota bacterium]
MPRLSRPVLGCLVQFSELLGSGSLSIAEIPAIARRLAVSGIEYREVYWKDKDAELPDARERMRVAGLLPTYATFTPLLSADPVERERLLGDIRDAHALGSPLLRVFRGHWPFGGDEAAMWRGGREAIALADSLGVQLAMENFARSPGNHRHEIEAALHFIDRPSVGVNLDTANYVVNGEDVVENTRALLPRIIYAHLKDTRTTDSGVQVVPVGDGELDWTTILDLFDSTGRAFPVTFEYGGGDDPERAIARGLEGLARCGLEPG